MKTKALISCAVTAQLICVFVFAYAKSRFSHDTAQLQGDRFGGALDAAAKQFSDALDSGIIPMEFVNSMRKKGQLIMGIGHRVKSVS